MADEKWMVRSGGRIVGPYKKSQIPQLLRSREIQLRDEISAPMSRWVTLEFSNTFQEDVENYKRELNQEKTEFSLTPTQSGLTQTATDLMDSELTEEITQDLSGFTQTKEIVVDNVDEVSHSRPNLESAQYQLKGLGSNPYVNQKSKKTSLYIQMAVVAVAVVVMVGLFLRFQNQRPEVEKLSAAQLKSVVLQQIERGDYEEALRLMKVRKEDPVFISDLGIYYALLSIQVEGQTLQARRILNQLMDSSGMDMKVRVLTGLGLSYLVDQDFSQAHEFFTQARSEDVSFVPPRVDELVTQYLEKKPLKEAFLLSQDWVLAFPEALLTVAVSIVKNNRTDQFSHLKKILENQAAENFNYRLEFQFLAAYLGWRMNPKSLQPPEWRKIVDVDPSLTEQHRQNVFIFRKHLQWKTFLPLCQQMVKFAGATEEGQALEVFCLLKANDFQAARSRAESMVDKFPKSALAQSWFALSLSQSGSPDQASVILGRAMESNRKQDFLLPYLLQARFCEKTKNQSCAESSWKSLIEKDYNNLAAIAGLVRYNLSQGSRTAAEKLLKRGLQLSPDYKPFLALKDEWRAQL
ncbi:MAG: hypothetical protein CL676_01325 [Bdellovibrionaceae bacterium]|nr:hypothetical protein [Pseudobdellovibrionaceae bacterium]